MLGARAAEQTGRPVLFIVASEWQAEQLAQDLCFFSNLELVTYPGYDIPPYTPLSPDPLTVAERISTLYRILTADRQQLIVSSSEALLRRVLPRKKLAALAELLIRREDADRDELALRLTLAAYEKVSLVRAPGEFSMRGGIFDVFPPGLQNPVRFDFFGDTVESIRGFNPITQRAIAELDEVVLLPASDILFPAAGSPASLELARRFAEQGRILDWDAGHARRMLELINSRQRFPGIEFLLPLFYDASSTFLDYLHPDTIVFMADPHAIKQGLQLNRERITSNFTEAAASSYPALPPDQVFISPENVLRKIADFSQVQIFDLPDHENQEAQVFSLTTESHLLLKQEIDLQRKEQGLISPLAQKIRDWLADGDQVVAACRSNRHARNLAELLSQHDLPTAVMESPCRLPEPGKESNKELLLFGCPLAAGFDLVPDTGTRRLHVLSETELFGEKRLGPKKTWKKGPAAGQAPVSFDELTVGDVVVHKEHGLGIYQGLVTLSLQGVANDFLQLAYLADDKLYVPVDRIDSVGKYKGLSDQQPKLDRLGGKSWLNAKKKVREAVWQVAQDLLELYARRELRQGRPFSRPGEMFRELEESFPFEETAGQDKAINEVLADLASEKPMDRLVCGDVGYGKTEVAIRAAFKVVEDGFQVAMLVPTTVLAEQHAKTFLERLDGFPLTVASLNRFRSPAEQKQILAGLRKGAIDIIIGTHRLLSRDIAFKRLGLLIIDEEHRFGVSHKEKIKRLKAEVDVLTLTATPIPRTLQMSLLGVRDLSVINTPPEHRRSIKTFMARHDDLVIKEAVLREMQRKGQVFLVHNRVRSIREMAQKVQKLVPGARVEVAHGQMAGRRLEEIMVRFINREIDVLVCTTIIESGLDIANANTIIITRADQLGLAEVYQLRGRVGRSSEQSYAYLLVPSLESLSREARGRLRALLDSSELGGGFKLALSDLQIRGGGNILGVSQSGHIEAVGYDLYLDLLQKTVSDLKRRAEQEGPAAEELDPEINLRISAYIPKHYISDNDQRYIAYRKIAAISSGEELLDMQDEINDRYGRIPPETANLFAVMALKIELRLLRISRLEQGKDSLVFSFADRTPVAPEKILQMMEKDRDRIRFTPDARLLVRIPGHDLATDQMIINACSDVLQALEH